MKAYDGPSPCDGPFYVFWAAFASVDATMPAQAGRFGYYRHERYEAD